MAERPARPSRRALRPPTLEVGVGVLVAAWTMLLAARPIGDNSFFTHLATGHLILDGGVPRSDPYSYTAAGEPWVVQSWLASLVYAVVDDIGGFTGLQVLTGLLAGLLAGLCWRLTRPGATLASRLAAIVLLLATIDQFLSPRPMLMGLLAIAVVMLSEEERWQRAWPLALLGVVWVNVHGSWPLGIVLVVVSMAGRLADGRWNIAGTEGQDTGGAAASGPFGLEPDGIRRFGFLVGGILVGGVASLAGPRVLVFPIEMLGRSDDLRVIVEWQSPGFERIWARLFLVMAVVAVLGLIRRPSLRGWMLWSVFVAAALFGLRNIPVAAIVLVPSVAQGLAGLGSVELRRRTPIGGVLVAAAVVIAAVGLPSRVEDGELRLDGFPMEALERLEAAGMVTDPDIRLLTNEDIGNLIELRHGTEGSVFFDDRVDMYPPEVLDDYMALVRARSGWSEVLDRWDVDLVLWRVGLPLSTVLAEADGWEVVHEDDQAIVACRVGSDACSI